MLISNMSVACILCNSCQKPSPITLQKHTGFQPDYTILMNNTMSYFNSLGLVLDVFKRSHHGHIMPSTRLQILWLGAQNIFNMHAFEDVFLHGFKIVQKISEHSDVEVFYSFSCDFTMF